MKRKDEMLAFGKYRCIRTRPGAERPIEEQLGTLCAGIPFRVIPQGELSEIAASLGAELARQGCRYLYGSIAYRADLGPGGDSQVAYTDIIPMDVATWSLRSGSAKSPGDEWMVIEALETRFQVVETLVGRKPYRFAVIRNEATLTADGLCDELRAAGHEPLPWGVFELLAESRIDRGNHDLVTWHDVLDERIGYFRSVCDVSPETRAAFGGRIPAAHMSWLDDDGALELELADEQALSLGRRPLIADLVPIA